MLKLYDGLNIIITRDLPDESMQIALAKNLTIYDSIYVASAQKINGTILTSDQKLCNNAGKITTVLLNAEKQ